MFKKQNVSVDVPLLKTILFCLTHMQWLDPEGLKTRGGGIDCRRHESSGVSREMMRGGLPLSWGGPGISPGKFLKLDRLRVHFHAIFEPFSVILQADFFFLSFQEVAGSKTAGATFFFGVILSRPLIQEGQLSVSDERMWTVLVNYLCISLPRKCDYINLPAQK